MFLFVTAACHSKPKYKPVRFDAPPTAYISTAWTARSTVQVDRTPGALSCDVKADPAATRDAYGGIMLPANACKSWRLDLAFSDAAAVQVAYVDALNAQKQRVARWQTAWGKPLAADRVVYTFVPDLPAHDFTPVASEGKGPIDSIHLFVRLKPATSASFQVLRAELAE